MRKLDIPSTIKATEDWIGVFVETSGCSNVIIGLSGGIDSAVSSMLCKRALGDRVTGIIMPCYSNPQDEEDAHLLANTFGIKKHVASLNCINDGFVEIYPGTPAKLARANLRSRLRMCTLYLFANSMGALVCGTTNLTEMHTGYFTKFGDGGIDFEPIAGLFKSEVREVARYLGVPSRIIEKAPSAGLWEGQTDEGELGITYDRLDSAIYAIMQGSPKIAPEEDILLVRDLHMKTEHKRALPSGFTWPVVSES